MGEEIPPEEPVIDPDKWYSVIVDYFYDESGKTGCDMEYQGQFCCKMWGTAFQEWLDLGLECTKYAGLCSPVALCACLVIYVDGPFDTEDEASDRCYELMNP